MYDSSGINAITVAEEFRTQRNECLILTLEGNFSIGYYYNHTLQNKAYIVSVIDEWTVMQHW